MIRERIGPELQLKLLAISLIVRRQKPKRSPRLAEVLRFGKAAVIDTGAHISILNVKQLKVLARGAARVIKLALIDDSELEVDDVEVPEDEADAADVFLGVDEGPEVDVGRVAFLGAFKQFYCVSNLLIGVFGIVPYLHSVRNHIMGAARAKTLRFKAMRR